ncbi:MAG: formate dehydrogenase subunit gamma [Syntrophales bacterium]|nr:formate dehydrogenase subunit gamma [Syntrophales bacterium]MDY0043875.1 formate dehydrogenase subunit gamma [Syntrophales bacterium]
MIPQKGMIKVSDSFERIVHWCLAISCLVLIITGLGMMFRSFNFIGIPFGGMTNLKLVHNFVGLFFIPALFFAILVWWREAGKFKFPDDLEWIKVAGGYLWHVDEVPKTGKYNPGQKAFFWAVAFFGTIMVITGLIMWFPLDLPREFVRWMYPLHALGFLVIFAFFFVHLYLGTIGVPGSAQAMFTGYVTRSWAEKQCPLWLEEMEKSGKLEIYGQNTIHVQH